MDTYKDGVGIDRCSLCHSPLRSLDGELLVPLRVDDLESIVLALHKVATILETVNVPLEEAATIISRAVGRNTAQLQRAAESRSADRSLPFNVDADDGQ